MNCPDGLYRIRKSISASPSPFTSPWLTRSRLTCSPRVVEIRRLVWAGFCVIGVTKTSCGSLSECSAEKALGSPTTTELTGSGMRIAVA
jgi:hypothetical protein